MKFCWKIFFIFTSFMAIVFCVFGIWIVTSAFQTSLDREIERGNSENQMFQFAFVMALDSLGEEYMVMQDTVIKDISNSLKNSTGGGDNSYIRVYDENEKILFDDAQGAVDTNFISELKDSLGGYQIIKDIRNDRNNYYLAVMCRTDSKDMTFYLENIIDISYIYEERESLFQRYRIAMVVLLLITGIVTLFLSQLLTHSVVNLSRITRRFSRGDYQIRAKEISSDEIGELTKDFNVMADNLSQKIDELSQNARRQEDFTASFAHELKTPLTSIIGYADMLRTMELDREETMEAAHYIYSQGKRLESLSFKLLELIVSGKQNHEFQVIPTQSLVNEVQQLVKVSLQPKQIQLFVQIQQGYLCGDKDLVISLLVNLIDNSRKALGANGSIWVEGVAKDDGYEFQITDNGCGIPSEELGKITEAFYMVDKSRARKEGGAGLGMTLCSRIVHLHQATWSLTSQENKGTSIRVFFPKKEVG